MSAVLAHAVREARAADVPRVDVAAGAGDALCFHCGLPVPDGSRWQVRVDGQARSMCCPGCAAAAEAIVGGGHGDYYRSRTGFAATAVAGRHGPQALGAPPYEGPEMDGEGCFTLEGVRCSACVWLVERRLGELPGVTQASLDLASARVSVRWDPARCGPGAIVAALGAVGYPAYPYDAQRHGEQLDRARRMLLRRLSVAGLALLQILMYALPWYLAGEGAGDGRTDPAMDALIGSISLVLTLPVVLYSAQPFFAGALRGLERGMPGMDLPVALGIGAAFAGSCAALAAGKGQVYFDAITLFVFLLLGSRYLELDARRRATQALETLRASVPASALRLRGDPALRAAEVVPAARLAVGDLVLVQPGKGIPADGVVVEGSTDADFSLLSGETRTRQVKPGDRLPAGAVNAGQAIVLRITATARDGMLAMLVRLVERAGLGKPAMALWGERVATWCVCGLLALAAVVWLVWNAVDPARAWHAAIAVLVVSCPCALSLATPTALAAAGDRLLRRGVLAVSPHALETFERATHVVFDKTGTLTLGRPVLRQVLPVGLLGKDRCLRIAAALQSDNSHPIGAAMRAAMCAPGVDASNLRADFGRGIEGTVDGVVYRVGTAEFVAGLAGGVARAAAPMGTTTAWLGCAGSWLARFDLSDALRDEAAVVVRRLRDSGKTVILLSGDDQAATQSVATQLGIGSAVGGRLPAEKLLFVSRLQEQGAVVAMVGDGVNDAAVLRGADVSFAMGRGAELAQLHADGVLLGDSLDGLLEAADTARRSAAVIRQNLAWAAAYNLVAIPVAATGLLNPWLAAAGMAFSSALVVLNALRLRGS